MEPGRSQTTLLLPTEKGVEALAQRSRSGLTYQVGLNEAVFRFLGLSSDSGVVAGHPAESAGVGVGRAIWAAICEAAGDPPSGLQAARGQAGEDE